MKIESSTVALNSQHVAVQEQTKTESLKFWVGNKRPDFEGRATQPQSPLHDSVDLSRQAQAAAQNHGKHKAVRSRNGESDDGTDNNPALMLIRMLIESMTGKKIKFTSANPVEESAVDPEAAAQLSQATNAAQAQAQPQAQQSGSAGFGLEYDSRETYVEAESMSFSAQGVVRTADGKQIDFRLQLSMQRAFASEQTTSVRLGDAVQQKDPLVINFAGTAAQLSSTKFSFDIDSDGSADKISFVGPNSGFIALDKNNDGQINDGSELFGTKSGDGFQDLAAYDSDNNGWIDDNDPVFSQLKVWMKNAQGADSLVGLKTTGVGALYLDNISSPFELKNSSNESQGTVKASSVYLKENGSVGTLQEIDLTL
jgi:hypothetical protein